jgi:transcriptional regulator with XRE-family HTH domain
MFSDRLKELRKQRRITQVELADAIGVERSSIGKYEGNSHVMPSDDVKLRIAQFFGVSVDYLLDNETPMALPRLTPDEQRLLDIFRSLNAQGQTSLMITAESFAANPSLQQDPPAITAS